MWLRSKPHFAESVNAQYRRGIGLRLCETP